MVKIYLALGSNLGSKTHQINDAISKLENYGIIFKRCSPLYTTPALLLEDSPSEWNIPYLNCVIEAETNLIPDDLLFTCKTVEKEMSRDFNQKWSPRPIDIDILYYNDQTINLPDLNIPHKEMQNRAFVLDPLSWLDPELILKSNLTVIDQSRKFTNHQPIFMGIINVTPDSFSDGGKYYNTELCKAAIDAWCDDGVNLIDIGAESSRPGATQIGHEEELKRLAPILKHIKNKPFNYTKPIFSLDTHHPETALKAIESGFDIINDVTGITNPEMIDVLQQHPHVKCIAMHSLTIPTDKNIVMKDNPNVIKVLHRWFNETLDRLTQNNISKDRIILDPGIGFGKTASQSLQIMQNIEEFHIYGVKILVGHSRKSFMNNITNRPFHDRDIETIAMSCKLAEKGVDILRVHDPLANTRALLGYQHMTNQFV